MIYQIERFSSLGSTNDYLKQLAESGAPEGTVVIAREQTAGRGRFGRRWLSPKGGAWFSLLLRPPIPVEQAGCISVLIAVSLARALREHWGVPVGVKWPNDLYGSGKKLGGILIELSSRGQQITWLIAGVGINVNNELPKETRVAATSLARELGRDINLERFFEVALEAIARGYERFLAEGFDFLRKEWQGLSVLPKRIEVLTDAERLEAQVLGLSESGKLIVRVGESIRELTSEEVTLAPQSYACSSGPGCPMGR
jgi:BirA family biotin operon repressor/biotin-[acetyl-CoA-carboxylase] ligase